MSINWVMLSEDKQSFTPLQGEQLLYQSPLRTSLSLQSLNRRAGSDAFAVQCSTGRVFLTNRRVVYLPTPPIPTLESFAAPILNLHDTHVSAPFFGPNVWTAIVQPVPGGNIPVAHAALELKMTFKEGGAYDFHSSFERIKERLQQAVDVARESGRLMGDGAEDGSSRGAGPLDGVDLNSVHLDQLPAYEASAAAAAVAATTTGVTMMTGFSGRLGQDGEVRRRRVQSDGNGKERRDGEEEEEEEEEEDDDDDLIDICGRNDARRDEVPSAEPPRYEDVQRESVADELERQLRQVQ